MRDVAERAFLWSIFLASVAFVGHTVGIQFQSLKWLPWVFLLGGLASVLALGV